mmetsp:Transcript_8863/g.28559  ORF Transcript_8863/g.28559 Transcript_8863/m.28559 type:complete len:303 (+) Transcript_8863:1184-2092(+)
MNLGTFLTTKSKSFINSFGTSSPRRNKCINCSACVLTTLGFLLTNFCASSPPPISFLHCFKTSLKLSFNFSPLYSISTNSCATETNSGTPVNFIIGFNICPKLLCVCLKTFFPSTPVCAYLSPFIKILTITINGNKIVTKTIPSNTNGANPSNRPLPNNSSGNATPNFVDCLPSGCPYFSKFSLAISFVNVLYAGATDSVKNLIASGSEFLSGWYFKLIFLYALLISDGVAPIESSKISYGSNLFSSVCMDFAQNKSRKKRIHPRTIAKFHPLKNICLFIDCRDWWTDCSNDFAHKESLALI